MQKTIKREYIALIILFFIECIACGTLFFLLDGDYIKDYTEDILSAALFCVITINLIAMIISLGRIAKAKFRTDISSLDVIGHDISKVYDFTKIGLLVTDKNNEVIWANEFFMSIYNKIIDKDLFEWEPQLRELNDKNLSETKITINNRVYLVKCIKEASLYIFNDITRNEELLNYQISHSPVVGIILLDNYQELVNLIDDLSINEDFIIIQNSISEYAKRFNMFIRKYKSDSFLFICNKSDYERILEDGFSILSEIKRESTELELTLSIGIATGLDDYSRLYEMASSALDVALSRGGNQAVVSSYGKNLQFFGGQTETKEKKNTVQSRVMSNSLKTLIEESNSVYIMGHSTADLDAIGSALGLYAFASTFVSKVKIVYDEFSLESKTKKAFKNSFSKDELNILTISPGKAIDEITSKSLLILTDVHSPNNTISPSLVKKVERIAVIDHHRRGESYVENASLTYIEPSSSSASEMVAEMIRYSTNAIEVKPIFATFMLAGILLDTNYYRKKIGARTFDASYILKTYGGDNILADSFLKEEYEEYALRTKIMSNSITPVYGIVISKADSKYVVEQATLARVATETLHISGIKACFVVGRISDKEIGVSSRSDGTVSCQILCEKLGGGGSYSAAACKFTNTTIDEVVNKIKEVLDNYLDVAQDKVEG